MKISALIKLFLLTFVIFAMFALVSCSTEPFIAYDVEGGSQGLMYQKTSPFVPGYQVVGIGECRDADIVIPAKVKGIDVTAIGESAFENCTSVTSVTLPHTVVSIWNGAFSGCTSLKTVKTHDELNVINGGAFKGCISLEEFNMPNSISFINADAFEGCTALDTREYDNAYYLGNEKNPYLVLIVAKSKDIESCLVHPNAQVIAGWAFEGCKNLESIESLDAIKVINQSAFRDCVKLTNFVIPSSIQRIDAATFWGCTSLESITVPKSVNIIFHYAFENCTSLKSIIFEGTVKEWKKIQIFNQLDSNTGSYIIYCVDGEIDKDGTVTYN